MRRVYGACLLLALVPFAGATDPPAPKPAPVPTIIVAPGGTQPAPAPSPTPLPPAPIPSSVRLAGLECEFLALTGYTGAVSWDVTAPDSFAVPVKLFECKPKSSIPAWRAGAPEPQVYEVGDLPTVQVFAINTGRATLAAWGVSKEGKPVKLATFAIEANRGPQPPPDPPGPIPPDPKPVPATSFRVIFVVESGKTLTAEQNGVVYGRVVEEYLTRNATGGKAGFKRRDPNTPSEAGVMGELWTAAKAKLKQTDPPCVVVEKNNNVEIIPLAASPEAMVAVFDEYLKGAK